jgi:hypothetical protein
MTFALEIWRILIGVKVENVSGIGSISSSKKMTTVTESDFSAAFNLDIFEKMKLL